MGGAADAWRIAPSWCSRTHVDIVQLYVDAIQLLGCEACLSCGKLWHLRSLLSSVTRTQNTSAVLSCFMHL